LYSGFWSCVLSCFVYKLSYDCFFSITRTQHQNFWVRHLVRGYAATTLAKTVAYPFLTVSRRRMVAAPGKYRGDFDAFKKIVESEGLSALWSGFGLNFIGTFLATAATLVFH